MSPLRNVHQPNLLFLCDLYGCGLSEMISRLSQYQLKTVFRPSAKLCCLIQDIDEMIKYFSKRDVVVIIGGSSDIRTACDIGDFICTVKNVLEKTKRTNLVLSLLPLAINKPELNFRLANVNKIIESLGNRFDHTILLHLELAPLDFFSDDCTQFNSFGQASIAKWICDICGLFDKIHPEGLGYSRADHTQTNVSNYLSYLSFGLNLFLFGVIFFQAINPN